MKNLFLSAILLSTALASSASAQPSQSCWGQASAAFAQMGIMGEHASEQEEPRVGLAGLAQLLFEAGIIPEPTLTALGIFVTTELGLSIDACMADAEAVAAAQDQAAVDASCWGQASAVFAQMGIMGKHASGQDEPRLGLRRLAALLAELGIIPDDSMASLGAFVAAELGLEIEACM